MKRIKLFCTAILLLITIYSNSQRLQIGDVIPDIEIKNIFNYSTDKLRLSDFKNKLILLDFWSTNCSGCIKGFPKMDSLQKRFAGDIQIILVNRSSKDSTQNFFSRRKRIQKPDLPFITADTTFQSYFPHSGEPFYVLIDSQRRVKSIPNLISFASIAKYVKGENIQLQQQPQQKTVYLSTPIDQRLNNSIQYSSILLKTIPGIQLTNPVNTEFENITLSFASISKLYAIAYSETSDEINFEFLRPGKLVLEVTDKIKYLMPTESDNYEEWFNNYSYSYQLILPKNLSKRKYEFMKEDLKRGFDVIGRIEKRKVKCLTLIRISLKDKIKASGGKKVDSYMPVSIKATKVDSLRSFENQAYKSFSDRLSYIVEYFLKKPFMDATGYNKNGLISMKMKGEAMDSFNLEAYRDELKKYDLDLIERDWVVDVLVLKEPHN